MGGTIKGQGPVEANPQNNIRYVGYFIYKLCPCHQQGYLTVKVWLVLHNTSAISILGELPKRNRGFDSMYHLKAIV